jgi:hypothetical protein
MYKKPKLYADQKEAINVIQKSLGLDKMYLYRYVGNYKKIKTMPYEIVLGIAKVEKIKPNELYSKMLIYALENSKGE